MFAVLLSEHFAPLELGLWLVLRSYKHPAPPELGPFWLRLHCRAVITFSCAELNRRAFAGVKLLHLLAPFRTHTALQ